MHKIPSPTSDAVTDIVLLFLLRPMIVIAGIASGMCIGGAW